MCLAAPTIASTGQAWRQSAQPMQAASSMTARARGPSAPQAASSVAGGRPAISASRRTPSSPPGGQRLTSAAPAAIASA
jgi:hypothetical protein